MTLTIYRIIFLILIYSFLGWVAETIVADVVYRRFVNRGFLNGPVCLVYGFAAVIMYVTMQELVGSAVYLFIGCAGTGTIVQWLTGKLLEKVKRHR